MSTDNNNNGLWRSTNGGVTWTRINSAAVATALGVGVGAAAPGQNYPATYVFGTVNGLTGFHRSDDQGATWTRINDDAHQFGWVTVIQGDPRVYGRLYVGANGRGVLYGDLDTAAPAVSASSFLFETAPNQVRFTFSENVADALSTSDVVVTRSGGGSISPIDYTYNTTTNVATFSFATPIADGDYTAKITAAGVKDNAGNAMSGDFSMPFFVLAADANRSRSVDSIDFNILAANFGATGKTFSQGNCDYDPQGLISTIDFNLLASQFGQSLAAPAAPAPAPPAAPRPLAVFNSDLQIDSTLDLLDLDPT